MPLGKAAFEEFIEHRTVKPPPILYKYMSMEAAWQILASRQVLWCSPLRFNDPFDTNWDWFWPVRTAEFRKQEEAMFRTALRHNEMWPADLDSDNRRMLSWTKRLIREHIDKHGSDSEEPYTQILLDGLVTHPDEVPLIATALRNDLIQRMRIFCLSEVSSYVPMWSHYADHHKGVAIGFVVTSLENAWCVPVEKVQYCEKMPSLIDIDGWCRKRVFGIGDPFLGNARQFGLIKHKAWEREDEWRFVSVEHRDVPGDKCLCHLPPQSVSRIILGCRADRTRLDELISVTRPIATDLTVIELDRTTDRFDLVESSRNEIAFEQG